MLHIQVWTFCLLLVGQGFGFVTFENSHNAEEARKNLHMSLIDGRTIEVYANTWKFNLSC